MENESIIFGESWAYSQSLFDSGRDFQIHFNPDGLYNGKDAWISDDGLTRVIWDLTLNGWKLSGNTMGNTQVINLSPNTPPITGIWSVQGSPYTAAANEGLCGPLYPLTGVVGFNQPGCICDGSIRVRPRGGVPPYVFSFDGGVSFGDFPIKTDICGGIYTVITKDSEGTLFTKTITIPGVELAVEYVISLNLVSEVTTGVNTVEGTYQLVMPTSLPPGVEITFDMNLASRFVSTPYINSANSTFTTQVFKDNNPIVGVSSVVYNTLPNTASGCQGYLLYNTDYNVTYTGLQIKDTDVYIIKTIKQFTMTCDNPPPGPLGIGYPGPPTQYTSCCRGYFNNMDSVVSNPAITGCNCCTVRSKSFNE
jgi:hypothetical protein